MSSLESAISTIQSMQKYASIPLQANKIKDVRRRTSLVKMVNDLRVTQMPILENYRKLLRQMDANYLGHLAETYGSNSRIKRALLAGFEATKTRVRPVIQEDRKTLGDLIKDGCVAKS